VIPSSYLETLKKIRNAVIASALTVVIAPHFELDYLVTEE